jgi:addiction module RelE/StbE family toxin
MLRIVYSKSFLKSARRLPGFEQDKLARLLEILRETPFHPKLHTKSLTGPLTGFYSFRITRDWRVIFQFLTPDEIRLVEVGHRKEIYR